MRSLDKLQNAICQLEQLENVEEIKKLIHEFIVDNEPNKKLDKNLYRLTCDDDLRPAMQGVYYDAENKVAVSTDSHVIVVSKEGYNEKYAGKIIDKYGKEIEGRYPYYKSVIPSKCDSEVTCTIDVDALQQLVKESNAYCKEHKITGSDKRYVRACYRVGGDTWLLIDNLLRIAPWCDGKITYTESHRACISRTEDGVALVMPMIVPADKVVGKNFALLMLDELLMCK